MKTLRSSILTAMRIFLVCIGVGLGTVYASSTFGQSKIDIDVKEVTLEELFIEIQNRSNYVFFYSDKVLSNDRKVSVKLKRAKLTTILDEVFHETSLRYKINGKQVIIKELDEPTVITPIEKEQEIDPVNGKVVDKDGKALPGVNITIEGSTVGTVTDSDGSYSIEVSEGDVLVFSFIGLETKTVRVGTQTTINITLLEDVRQMAELVVVGYSTQSKESLTGSVGVIDGQRLEQVPVSSFEQALKGTIPGLQATGIDGAPGANTQIRIRGIGSITASSEPLYVIDGIPIQSGSIASNDNGGRSTNVMAALNPNDIESISVLKDAASTAIYGSRGANGVILITTKSGESDTPTFSLKTLTGFSGIAISDQILRPLNAQQYTQLFLEGHINNGDTPAQAQAKLDNTFQQLTDPSTGQPTDTNWLDAILRTGVTQSYDLSASGRTDNVNYYFSGSYFDQESFVIGSGFQRLSTRANLKFQLSDRITVSNNISISDMVSNTFFDGGSWDNPFKATLELSPLIPIYDEQGRFNGDHINYFPMAGSNPVGSLSGDDIWKSKTLRIIDNFAVAVEVIDNLTVRSQWNFDLISLDEAFYKNPRYGGGARGDGGIRYDANTLNKNWVGTQTVNYDWELSSNHFINVLAGYEAQQSTREFQSARGTQFPNEKLRTLNSASSQFEVGGEESEFTFASIFGRVNYDFAGKYFVSGSLRRDGSSRFGADNRWGTFYSFGGGWILSNEPFLNAQAIDLLKLRSSWGVTGNAAIGDFPSQGLYTYGQDYNGSPGGIPIQVGNPNLTWEKQKNFNLGMDFELFSRFSGTVEYFKRISSDLILDVPISRTTGFTSVTQNFGEMTNSGMELALNADIVDNSLVKWSVGFNTTILKNEITRLTENFIDGVYRREEGQDFQSFYLYGFAGINPTNGQILWYTDETKSEAIETIAGASRFLDDKSATPDHFGGINTAVEYGRLSLNVSFIYSQGNYIFDGRARGSLSDGRLTPRSTATWAFDNRWVPGKTDALLPQHKWGGSPGSGERATSRWLYDGSFVRLRDVTLAYNLPEQVISMIKLRSARVYMRGTNLLTFTKDKDLYFDPEQAVNGTYDAMTPQARTVSFGVDVSF